VKSLSKKLTIAIDGPSGSGKSTLSKMLADRLGYLNIDTGAMYRSVALLAHQQNINPQDDIALKQLCADLSIEFMSGEEKNERVIVNGVDVTSAIRTPEVSLLTPVTAAQPVVREALVRLQREMGAEGGVVLEGRDIGTVVFPYAEVKFFLSATATERGRRRYEELQAKGVKVGLQQTIDDVEARDAIDMSREYAPLIQAEDAFIIDSTCLTIDGVLEVMLSVVKNSAEEK